MKLTARIAAILIVGVLLLMACGEALTLRHENQQFHRDMEADGIRVTDTIAEFVGELGRLGQAARARELVRRIDQLSELRSVRIVPMDDLAAQRPAGGKTASRVESLSETRSHWTVDAQGQRWLCTYAPLEWDQRPAAIERRELAQYSADNTAYVTLHATMLAGATALLGALLSIVLGAMWVGRPLQQLIAKTLEVGRGEFSSPLNWRRRDELGQLGSAVDRMCSQLQAARHDADRQMTARLAAVEQLRHADRLRTVGHLAAGIAHEIGTPLNVISGRADLIASGRLERAQIDESVQIIKDESARITQIVSQLLDFARRNPPQVRSLDLNQLAERTTALLETAVRKANCRVIFLPTPSTVEIAADPHQIQQAITNLLINAIDASPSGAEVTVAVEAPSQATPPEHVAAPSGPYAAISIRDHGSGIAAEHRDKIFEPFFTTKDVGHGTGLGLSIAFGIVQEHGGWIEVESRRGRGTCCRLVLPCRQSAEEDSAQ